MASIFAIRDSFSKFFGNQFLETSNELVAIFSKDETKMRKQIRSNSSKGDAIKNEKIEISFNRLMFFLPKSFGASKLFCNLSPI